MLIYKPEYYDRFRCIASACPDCCCKEWDIQVDEETARRYRSLSGDLGDRLRRALTDTEGETYLTMTEGRCPFWQADGLCQVQLALGEEALCRVCREYPRLTHDYGDFRELGLELSCPEAARILFSTPPAPMVCVTAPGGENGDYDREAMAVLQATRENVRAILETKDRPVREALTLAFLYGCQAQSELDGGESFAFDPEAALAEARELATPGDLEAFFAFFRNLEILTPQWRELLSHPVSGKWEPGHLTLARYLVDRYWLQAVSDYDLYSRVKLMVVACLLVKHLPGPLVKTAQLFSKEIENDAENVDALLDAAYTGAAFRDGCLLGLLAE